MFKIPIKILKFSLKHLVAQLAIIFFITLAIIGHVQATDDNGILDGETAQTNPKTRAVTVSAIMPDVISPSIPILITPTNHSLLNNNQVSFSWQGSTDNVSLGHYQFWLNGTLYLDNLPLTSAETASYSLTADSLNNVFYLLLKPPLSDGEYTWKIVAVDTVDNKANSATWSFTLDTQSPIFIINNIDSTQTSISASDKSTVPTQPIELTNIDPWISGTGEVGAKVTLTLIDQANVITTYQFTVDSKGRWKINLASILPKDRVIKLDFVIVDQAGNTSTINSVPVIYKTRYIEIGIPAIIAPTHTVINTTPGAIKPPVIRVPLTSPTSVKISISKTISNLLSPNAKIVFTQAMHQTTVIGQRYPLFNWLALMILVTPLLTFITWCLAQLNQPFGQQTWSTIWWLLGYRRQEVGGVVFTWPQLEPVQLATVKLIRYSQDESHSTSQKLLTNEAGFFQPFNRDSGQFYIDITHGNINYPTKTTPPNTIEASDFYKQEIATLDSSNRLPPLIIPTDATAHPVNSKLRLDWYRLARLKGSFMTPHLGLMMIVTIVFTSWINLISISFYLAVITKRIASPSY